MQHAPAELWGMFAAGILIHVLKSAGSAVRNGIFPNKLAFLSFFWDVILVRAALQSAIFLLWLTQSSLLIKLGAPFGISLPGELPPSGGVSFMLGYFGDSVLDYVTRKIPQLRREIPVVTTEMTEVTRKTVSPSETVIETEKTEKSTTTVAVPVPPVAEVEKERKP